MPIVKKTEDLSALEQLPAELAGKITKYLDIQSLSALTRASADTYRLFQPSLCAHQLLHAVFMSDVDGVQHILHTNPEFLFVKGTYRMPLYNQDGTWVNDSVQIYQDTSPLELSLYTGDWNVWNAIYPYIPYAKIVDVCELMQKVKRGGPDLVKINFNPTEIASWEELQRFDAGSIDDNPCMYKLLGNPDGILCFEPGNDAPIQYFYANQDTQKLEPIFPNDADDVVFKELRQAIHEMPMNSSCRTSDIQHDAIKNAFDKNLERNGIHSVLKGVRYQDTHDGCYRLINAYRKFAELYHQHLVGPAVPNWPLVNSAWVHIVGLAQLLNMPRTNFFICDESKPFCPGQEDFKGSIKKPLRLVGRGEFTNCTFSTHPRQRLYPYSTMAGLGEIFGLYKSKADRRPHTRGTREAPGYDDFLLNLLAVGLLDEVTIVQFGKFERALAQRLQDPSVKHSVLC